MLGKSLFSQTSELWFDSSQFINFEALFQQLHGLYIWHFFLCSPALEATLMPMERSSFHPCRSCTKIPVLYKGVLSHPGTVWFLWPLIHVILTVWAHYIYPRYKVRYYPGKLENDFITLQTLAEKVSLEKPRLLADALLCLRGSDTPKKIMHLPVSHMTYKSQITACAPDLQPKMDILGYGELQFMNIWFYVGSDRVKDNLGA